MTMLILSLLVHENARHTSKQKRAFYKTHFVIIISAIMEWLGLLMNEAPSWTKYIHYLVKTIDYTLTPAIAYFFINQVDSKLSVKKYMGILEIIDILIILLSVPFGWVFYIDQNNVYRHGPFYIVYPIIYVLMMILLIIGLLQYGRRFASSNKKSLFAIMLLALVGIVFQETAGSFMRTGYLALAMGSTLLFIHFEEFCQQEMDEDGKAKTILLEKDALTDLYSRYAYNEQLKKHSNPPLSSTLCVLLIDINGLKMVNDTKGHEKGDELICETAHAIRKAIQSYGHVYRTGGDEFVVLLDLSSYTIKEFYDILKREFYAYKIKAIELSEINVAIGKAYAKDYPDFTLEQLVEVADRDMYKDKANYYRNKRHDRRK